MQEPILVFAAVFVWGALHSALAGIPAKAAARKLFGPMADNFYRIGFNAAAVMTLMPVLAILARNTGSVLALELSAIRSAGISRPAPIGKSAIRREIGDHGRLCHRPASDVHSRLAASLAVPDHYLRNSGVRSGNYSLHIGRERTGGAEIDRRVW
jgi:hypothetical protein